MRDGGSFSTRRVTAKQNELVIFILACSFHKEENGYTHQIEMPKNIKPPEDLISWEDMAKQYGDNLPKFTKRFLEIKRPIDVKPTDIVHPFNRKDMEPETSVWFKLKDPILDLNLARKQEILTYISDYNILSVGLNRHASKAHWGNTVMASLDHAMWYFRDCDFEDWLLYVLDAPSNQNARTFCRGHIFTRDGKLVATVAQEGLMRPVQ
jgi:acyl-CoA thioesterase-2